MLARFSLFLLFALSLSVGMAAPLSRPTLMAAAVESATDDISSGWCGRGILSILKSAGVGERLQAGNGQDWEKILQQAGWKPVRCLTPTKAPLGSVLVYMGDAKMGKMNRGTPGGSFGHVELVALGQAGSRLYVSDSPRAKPGGSVPDNFTGRAWLPPGQAALAKAPSIEETTASVLEDRKRMALNFFDRRQLPAVTLTLNTVATTQTESGSNPPVGGN